VSSTVTCLTTLLTAAAAFAQAGAGEMRVRGVRPLAESDLAAHGVSVGASETDPSASLFMWRGTTLPLQAARDRVSVGMVDPDLLVVLAGGIRRALVVYFIDASGAIGRLITDDGRRLPAAFNAGQGSWPIAIGGGAFVVAFERAGKVELRAVGFGDKVLAARSLPAGATGFEVAFEPSIYKVKVQPMGGEDDRPLEFVHPSAPRVEFAQVEVDFGIVPVGEVQRTVTRLHNPSNQILEISLQADGVFHSETPSLRLRPGEAGDVALMFAPVAERTHRGRLFAQHAGAELPQALTLRGRGRGPLATVATAEFVVPRDSATPVADAVLAQAQASTAPSPPAPAGAAADVGRPADAALRAGMPDTRLEAAPQPPRLSLLGEVVEISGQRGEDLVLAVVSTRAPRAGAVSRPLAAWRARLSATEGTLRVAVSTLTAAVRADQSAAVLVLRQAAEAPQQSNLIELPGR
jgi:hypothetical protein